MIKHSPSPRPSPLPMPGRKRTGAYDAMRIPSNDLRHLAAVINAPDPVDIHLARENSGHARRGMRDLEPELLLFTAILKDALDSILDLARRPPSQQSKKLIAVAREAETWVFDERLNAERDWPCSFENICFYLKLDPTYLRKMLIDEIEKSRRMGMGARRSYSIRMGTTTHPNYRRLQDEGV